MYFFWDIVNAIIWAWLAINGMRVCVCVGVSVCTKHWSEINATWHRNTRYGQP